MASLRDIRRRIGSVKNTRQTTRAMKLVSAAKLRRATEKAVAAQPYGESLRGVLGRVAGAVGSDFEHPLLTQHKEVKKVMMVVLTSDRGLCGGFNNQLLRQAWEKVEEHREQGHEVLVSCYGKKARFFFEKRMDIGEGRFDLDPLDFVSYARELAEMLTQGFEAGDFQEAWLVFNRFESVMTQTPTFSKILPLSVDAEEEEESSSLEDYEYEPGADQVLSGLLPLYLETLLHQAFLEKEAGEHAARMTAMDSATRNAEDLIASLTLQYNRARQAAITTELIEIVSGAAAL